MITEIITNTVPSPEEIAIENARLEEEARKRRIVTKAFVLHHADAVEVAEKFNETWAGDFGAGVKVLKIAHAFPNSNKIMVTAPGVVLDACEAVIKEIDVCLSTLTMSKENPVVRSIATFQCYIRYDSVLFQKRGVPHQ